VAVLAAVDLGVELEPPPELALAITITTIATKKAASAPAATSLVTPPCYLLGSEPLGAVPAQTADRAAESDDFDSLVAQPARVKVCPLGNDGLHPRAVVPFTNVVEQVDAKLARTSVDDQKPPVAQVRGQFKHQRRIVYADSRHRSLVSLALSSLSRNDLAESRGDERPLVLNGGRSIHSRPASNQNPQRRQTRALSLIRS
jgi:hypothetical protein